MHCPSCGLEVNQGQKFCHNCGANLSQQSDSNTRNEARKQEFAGVLYKCPNCGEVMGSYQTHCEACGYELRGTSASNGVKQLSIQLDVIESQRIGKKKKKRSRKAKEPDEIDLRKITLIRSFGIPNAKEDLLDFAVLAASNLDYSELAYGGATTLSSAWMSALRQSYEKSRIIFSDSNERESIRGLIDEANRNTKKEKRKPWLWLAGIYGVLFGIIIIALIINGIMSAVQGNEYDINVQESHLNYVLDNIEDDIASGDFESARNKAYTLTFDPDLSEEKSEYWENKQKEVLRQIDRAENREI